MAAQNEPSTVEPAVGQPVRDDAAWVASIRAGDENAFRALVDQLHAPLIRLARAFVGSQAIAEDVAQETWLAVVRGLDAFEARSSLKTWIFSIVTNRARTRATREQRSVPLDEAHLDERDAVVDPKRFGFGGIWRDPPRAWEGRGAEAALLDHEFVAHLKRAIDDLPTNQRVVVTLRDLEGLTSEEVCNVLGIAETNQRVLLHRARSKLRTALEEYAKDG